MFRLERAKTVDTPYVLIDEESGYMHFEGECFNANVTEFFSEIAEWLENYMKNDFKEFTFDCELKYFNSSATKLLCILMQHMEAAREDGKHVTVNWLTTENNGINIECGEDFAMLFPDLDIHLVIRPS